MSFDINKCAIIEIRPLDIPISNSKIKNGTININ